MNFRPFTLLLLLLSAMPARALDLTPESLETPAGTASLAPRLTTTSGGDPVLTWLEKSAGGHRLLFSRFDGRAFEPPQLIREGQDFFANWADTPGLVVLPNGTWLAHWLQKSGQGTFAYDVMVAGSGDQGATWGQAYSPHRDGTLTEHGFVSAYAANADRAGLVWLDGRETDVRTLLTDEILHMAREGLVLLGIDEEEIERYIGIARARTASGQNGASWQRAHAENCGHDFSRLTAEYLALQRSGAPVHEWPL